MNRNIFFEVHTDLPREGPGNRASTARAMAACRDLPEAPRILDIACGPGMQTVDLAELLPAACITAVDIHPPHLEQAAARVAAAGVGDRVRLQTADMAALPFEADAFDLLWCEGAAYILGVQEALLRWRRVLRPGGGIAFTDAVWLTDQAPAELERWWQAGYPAMISLEGRLAEVNGSGYEVLEHFVLPEAAWWDDYYGPMSQRIERLKAKYADDASSLAALARHQREIDYYQRWSAHYGYLFVVARLATS